MTRDKSLALLNEVQFWLNDAMNEALALPESTFSQMRKKRLLCRELRGRCRQFHREYRKFASVR